MLSEKKVNSINKKLSITFTLLVNVMLILLSSCSDKDKNLAKAISERDSLPMLHTIGVNTLISDSGITKYKIITENDLSIYQTVDEGLDQKLKKVINEVNSYDELIEKLKSKRYTYNKISRMLIHILVGFTKDMANNMKEINYIRILGFSKKGQIYLNKVKKDIDIDILSKFVRNNKYLELELKSTLIYSLPTNSNHLYEEEYKNHLGLEE